MSSTESQAVGEEIVDPDVLVRHAFEWMETAADGDAAAARRLVEALPVLERVRLAAAQDWTPGALELETRAGASPWDCYPDVRYALTLVAREDPAFPLGEMPVLGEPPASG